MDTTETLLSIANSKQKSTILQILSRLLEGFQIEGITVEKVEIEKDGVDDEELLVDQIEWHLIDSNSKFVGKLIFGRKNSYSDRKFWFFPDENQPDYDLPAIARMPKNKLYPLHFWTYRECISIMHPASDAVSENRTY